MHSPARWGVFHDCHSGSAAVVVDSGLVSFKVLPEIRRRGESSPKRLPFDCLWNITTESDAWCLIVVVAYAKRPESGFVWSLWSTRFTDQHVALACAPTSTLQNLILLAFSRSLAQATPGSEERECRGHSASRARRRGFPRRRPERRRGLGWRCENRDKQGS